MLKEIQLYINKKLLLKFYDSIFNKWKAYLKNKGRAIKY